MAANDDTWEARIERARRLRVAVAAGGGLPGLGDDERDILVEALDEWPGLDERRLSDVRRKLPLGDEPVTVVPDLPPAPWRWGQVTPEQSRRDLQPKPRGVAPVPTDGTWVVSIDAAAQALDQHWRAQTVFRPDKTGLVCERSVRSAFCDH